VISVELARALRDAGLTWTPARGDRFIVVDRDMDDEVFVLSDMTIELHDYPGGPVLGFNGTTEWALDSLDQSDTLWLPGERQLRDRLGAAFQRLEHEDGSFRVQTTTSARSANDAAEAYGLALLDQLRSDAPASAGHERAEWTRGRSSGH